MMRLIMLVSSLLIIAGCIKVEEINPAPNTSETIVTGNINEFITNLPFKGKVNLAIFYYEFDLFSIDYVSTTLFTFQTDDNGYYKYSFIAPAEQQQLYIMPFSTTGSKYYGIDEKAAKKIELGSVNQFDFNIKKLMTVLMHIHYTQNIHPPVNLYYNNSGIPSAVFTKQNDDTTVLLNVPSGTPFSIRYENNKKQDVVHQVIIAVPEDTVKIYDTVALNF